MVEAFLDDNAVVLTQVRVDTGATLTRLGKLHNSTCARPLDNAPLAIVTKMGR
jgi:hypothetical protein